MHRGPASTGACCGALLLAACVAPQPPEPFDTPVTVEIARGYSSRMIAETLESEGIIASKWSFLFERLRHRDTNLKAGEYEFDGPVEAAEAFQVIAAGRVKLYAITIPEGLNRFEIAEVVEESGRLSGEEFLALSADPAPVKDLLPQAETLEGSLFPETYSLAATSTVRDLVEAMVAQFKREVADAHRLRTVEIDAWDGTILASMIEKETGSRGEQGLVSSVFHNRIGRGMLMQCDPTIVYGLVLENRYRGRIYLSDLSDPHPYNTYLHGGLPPGPITNPGRKSIRAAFEPSDSDFLFFVARAGSEGGHVFSESLRGHNRAVRNLRRHQGR